MKPINITNYTVVSEDTKKIYDDYFLHEKDGSLTKFYEYLNQFYIEKIDNPDARPEVITTKGDKFGEIKKPKEKASYNSFDVLFDKDNHDNLLTYYLLQPSFTISNSKLYKLNRTRPNWYHENKAGMTPISSLYWLGEVELLNHAQRTMNLDINIVNKKGEHPSTFFFKNTSLFKQQLKEILSLDKTSSIFLYRHSYQHVKIAKQILDENSEIYQNMSKKEIDHIGKLWEKHMTAFLEMNQNIMDNKYNAPLIQYDQSYTDLIMTLEKDISSRLNFFRLDKKINSPENSIKNKQNKI